MARVNDIQDNGVHVWKIDLDQFSLISWAGLISKDERQKAEKFVLPLHQSRSIKARVALKKLLSRYSGQDKRSLRILEGPFKKPFLPCSEDVRPLFFNTSHSDEMLMIALTFTGEIGIDIEQDRELDLDPSLLELVLTHEEKSEFNLLPSDIQHKAFFQAWTRKEALSKALGLGLNIQFNDLAIRGRPLFRTQVTEPDRYVPKDSLLFMTEFGSNEFNGSIAVLGDVHSVRFFDWEKDPL